jgi:hypothetical protein
MSSIAQRLMESARRRGQEDEQRRNTVVAEFRGDPQAMADEIRRLRLGLEQIADAVGWMREGAPFDRARAVLEASREWTDGPIGPARLTRGFFANAESAQCQPYIITVYSSNAFQPPLLRFGSPQPSAPDHERLGS